MKQSMVKTAMLYGKEIIVEADQGGLYEAVHINKNAGLPQRYALLNDTEKK